MSSVPAITQRVFSTILGWAPFYHRVAKGPQLGFWGHKPGWCTFFDTALVIFRILWEWEENGVGDQ